MALTRTTKVRRTRTVADLKRGMILDAARQVFERDGLDGASLRAIAAEAGYTPAALYFHFDSKEALYAEVLGQSLTALRGEVDRAIENETRPGDRFRKAALAFFDFYAANPRDLDLGFYLFRGGLRPHGLGRERDKQLNEELEAALSPIREAAQSMGAGIDLARLIMADTFAHASGVLLLAHTQRLRMFDAQARSLMERYVDVQIGQLAKGKARK